MEIKLVIQEKPLGIPDAITYCESYIKGDNFIVALGDNVIVATNFLNNFKSIESKHRSTICGFNVWIQLLLVLLDSITIISL